MASIAVALLFTALMMMCFRAFAYIYRLYQERQRGLHLDKLLGPTPNKHWLLGHLPLMKFSHESLLEAQKRLDGHKEAGLLWFGPCKFSLESSSPEVTALLLKNSRDMKDEMAYRYIIPWIGEGLLVAHGDKWARNRKLLTPAFHFDILKEYKKIMLKSTQQLMDVWESRLVNGTATFEVSEDTCKLSLEILLKCIFGTNMDIINSVEKHPYLRAVQTLSESIVSRVKSLPLMNDFIFSLTAQGRKFKKSCDFVHEFSASTVHAKRIQLAKSSDNKSTEKTTPRRKRCLSFLDIILTSKDELGQGLTDKEIQDECDTFMFEGHDTTANGLAWILHHLAAHPEMQDKCRQEVSALASDGISDDLEQLTYTTMFIKECLRMTSPVPSVTRILHSDTVLPSGVTISAGTMVGISPFFLQRSPRNWDDPLTFDPERFSMEASAGRHPYNFIPFSGGPRNCIGKSFALQELKTAVSIILSKYRLGIDNNKPEARMRPMLVLRSLNGLWVKIEKL